MEKNITDIIKKAKELSLNLKQEINHIKDLKEIDLIKEHFNETKDVKILFAGSGALPLSAILMHLYADLDVTLLDIDAEAINLSNKLIKKIGLPIPSQVGNVMQHDFSNYDIVFIASLIPNKEAIIKKLKEQNVKFYMMRGVDGVYQTFYEDLSDEIKNSGEYIYAPSDDLTLNSSYIIKSS